MAEHRKKLIQVRNRFKKEEMEEKSQKNSLMVIDQYGLPSHQTPFSQQRQTQSLYELNQTNLEAKKVLQARFEKVQIKNRRLDQVQQNKMFEYLKEQLVQRQKDQRHSARIDQVSQSQNQKMKQNNLKTLA